MSLFSLQLDVGQAGVFLFEKAVALRSYWLSQGIAGHGWDGLVKTIQALQIAPAACRRANKRVKAVQARSKHFGNWVMGTRAGDMIGVLNEQEATWPMVALLLPLAAVLTSEDAADVVVLLSEDKQNQGANGASGALVLQTPTSGTSKPLSFETAHNIILAASPYVGTGYELQEFSRTLNLVLDAFDSQTGVYLAKCCSWRPSPGDVSSLMREVARATQEPGTHIIITTNKGLDVLAYLAIMLFDCTVSLSVNNVVKCIARGQGPSVTIVVASSSYTKPTSTHNYAGARIGVRGTDNASELKQWQTLETKWMLSDYIHLRMTSWSVGPEAVEEFKCLLADRLLSFWWHGHIYGALASQYTQSLKNTKTNHQESNQPAPGTALRTLFSLTQVIERVRTFDPLLGDMISLRSNVGDPFWKQEASCWASTNGRTYAPYCPCGKHKGAKASPSAGAEGCILDLLHSSSLFVICSLQTIIFLDAPPTGSGIPLNCNTTIQSQVRNVPSGRNRGTKLDLSHILESASMLLGNVSTGSIAASPGVIGYHLIFHVSPGALYCRGVAVTSLCNSFWADSGYYALGGPPIPSEDITVQPSTGFEPTLLETGSTRSTIVVEASLKEGVGYIAFRVDWTIKGEEVSEYISPCDILYGMSSTPVATCQHEAGYASEDSKCILVAKAAAVHFHTIDAWNFQNHSYAKSLGLEPEDCLENYEGVFVLGMGDRGQLLRMIRYMRNRIVSAGACLKCAAELAVKEKANIIFVE